MILSSDLPLEVSSRIRKKIENSFFELKKKIKNSNTLIHGRAVSRVSS